MQWYCGTLKKKKRHNQIGKNGYFPFVMGAQLHTDRVSSYKMKNFTYPNKSFPKKNLN